MFLHAQFVVFVFLSLHESEIKSKLIEFIPSEDLQLMYLIDHDIDICDDE